MTTTYPLPDASKITHLLGLLFEGLAVKAGGVFDQSVAGGAWFGVFVKDNGEPVALCGADASLAASFGAALSMLPVALVQESANSRELSAVMRENLREVMNICTRLILDETTPHLRLDQIYPNKSLPSAASALLAAPKGRREFQVQVPKYGGGVLTIVSI
jgi:hypothetical protein